MRQAEANGFEALLIDVFECFDRKPPTSRAAQLWFDSLKEFVYEEVVLALRHWTKTKAKAPTIAEITSQLRDRTSVGLEKRNDRAKKQFADYSQLKATKFGAEISVDLRDLLKASKGRDRKKWARDLLADHAAGKPISQIQFAAATSALRGPTGGVNE